MKRLLFLLLIFVSFISNAQLGVPAQHQWPTITNGAGYAAFSDAFTHASFSSQSNTVTTYPFPAGWGNGGSEGLISANDGNIYTSSISGSYIYKFIPADNSIIRVSVVNTGFLQGVKAANGKIYDPAFSRNSIFVYDPSNNTSYEIGAGAFHGTNFLNGCAYDGTNILCAPGKGTDGFLVIHPTSSPGSSSGDTYEFIGASPSMVGITTSYFANVVFASDGNYYAIPFDGHEIYKITTSWTVTQPFSTVTGTGAGSYASGVEEAAHPGIIICVAYGAGSKVLKINIGTNTWALLGTQTGGYGGCTHGVDLKIICSPQHSTTMGIFDPETDTFDESITVPGIATNDVIGITLDSKGRLVCAPNGGNYFLVFRTALTSGDLFVSCYQSLYTLKY